MIDERLEEGFAGVSIRRLGVNSGSKPKFHSHSEASIRLMKNVNVTSSCWLWTGAIDSSGYGLISFKRRCVRVHRLLFRIFNGSIKHSICILHRCDTPRCVNPKHLFPGDRRDNSADCRSKSRTARGNKIGVSKLNESQASEIITAKLRKWDRRVGVFAKRFNVSTNTIRCVAKGIQWKYLYAELNRD